MGKNVSIAVVLLGTFLSCESGKDDPTAAVLSAKDCHYSSRKTIDTFLQAEGLIVLSKVGSDTEATIYQPVTNGKPYCACNLPASFSRDSIQVVFSADQKEIYPNERWKCLPMVLTSIMLLPERGNSK